jgi:CheY-like chemotaxis protein
MRILLVDDDKRLVRLLCQGLRSEGCAVDVAHDGLEGIRLAAEGSYDVIVLDVLIPGLNGFKVCEHLRAVDDRTPILMLTAKDGEYILHEYGHAARPARMAFSAGTRVDLMHQTDERIEVAQLRAAARIFAAIPRHLVASERR